MTADPIVADSSADRLRGRPRLPPALARESARRSPSCLRLSAHTRIQSRHSTHWQSRTDGATDDE